MSQTLLANRLADITTKAYAGKSLNVRELALHYQVSTKTIRRDFDRLCAILERCPDTGNYLLSASVRSQYNEQDLVRLIDDIGLKKALPLKAAQFLRSFINDSTSDCYHFQEQPLEADFISSLHGAFETAIKNRRTVSFLYKDKSRTVSPYLMIYSHGSWYLAAVSEGALKTFSLARIKFVSVQKDHFDYDPSVITKIKEQDTIWFGHAGARLEKGPKAQRTPASIAQFTYKEASGLFNTRDLTLAAQRLILICYIAFTLQ